MTYCVYDCFTVETMPADAFIYTLLQWAKEENMDAIKDALFDNETILETWENDIIKTMED